MPAEIGPGRADVVFPIIHGTTGEDGVLQGFLETLGLPYVGAGVTGSAVGMDKGVFKALLRDAGIPTPRPCVVRAAARCGARLRAASAGLREAGQRRLLGGRHEGQARARTSRPPSRSPCATTSASSSRRGSTRASSSAPCSATRIRSASIPGEIVPGHEFYDYDDKYRDDKAKLLIPAPVSPAVAQEARRLAVEVFRLCGVSGMARVDFFLERGTDRVLVNEINTLPGFTAISMYPKLWEASGLPLPALLDELDPPRPRAPGKAPQPPDRAPGRAGVARLGGEVTLRRLARSPARTGRRSAAAGRAPPRRRS